MVAVLGQDYISNDGNKEEFSKSSMVLTNNRLYQVGTIYEKPGLKYQSDQGKKVVSVNDITETSLKEHNVTHILIWAFISLSLAITMFILSSKIPTLGFLGLVPLFLASVLVVVNFISRQSWFVVEYKGGEFTTDSSWYSEKEINEFQRKIALIKNNLKAD